MTRLAAYALLLLVLPAGALVLWSLARPAVEATAGEALWAMNCSVCHGDHGGGAIGPALAGNGNLEREDYVFALITRGGDGMPAFGDKLAPAEIAALTNFVRASWGNDMEEVPPQRFAVQTWPQGVAEPSELFDLTCARCHREDGGGGLGPPLAGNDNLADAQYVAGKVLHGQGGMPAFEGLMPAPAVAALAEYVRNAWGNSYGEVPLETVLAVASDPPGSGNGVLDLGRRQFQGSCAPCHGPAGQGGVGPPLARNPVLEDADYLVDTVLHGRGHMPGFSHRLRDEQIAALVSFERTSWGDGFTEVSAAEVERRRQEPFPAADADLNAGAEIYRIHCEVCHGGGSTLQAPEFPGNPRLGDRSYVLSRIVMGGGGMPPFGEELSSVQIAAVASFIRTGWENDFGLVSVLEARNYHGAASSLEQSRAR